MVAGDAIAAVVRAQGATPPGSGAWPVDVLAFLAGCQARGEACALVVVTNVEGGGIRAPGALMGVAADGRTLGYVSNGCLDADVALQARQAIEAGETRRLRYGQGSPFIDLRLPCGGGVDVLILPDPDPEVVDLAHAALVDRRPIRLSLGAHDIVAVDPVNETRRDESAIALSPKPRIRIAGLGAEPLALVRLAVAAEMEVVLQTPDAATAAAALATGARVDRLTGWTELPPMRDDKRTAVVLMFHDHDWEQEILIQALAGPAFYVGALGSAHTHAVRAAGLRERGIAQADIARIRGPIGLVPGLRDAPLLAVSALAEIVASLP